MKKNITVRLAPAITILSAGMLSNIGSAQAIEMFEKVENSRFDFGSEGNVVFVNNIFDFTDSTMSPLETSPGVPGVVEITNATGGFAELFAGDDGSVAGATAEIQDIGASFTIEDGVNYVLDERAVGFYDNFKNAKGEDVDIRFDLTAFQVDFNEIEGTVNGITYNLNGFIVDTNPPADSVVVDNEIPVVFNFTTISGQIGPEPQPDGLPTVPVDTDGDFVIGDIPDLADEKPTISTSYSGTVITGDAEIIPEPITMLGSAAAIAFGYVSKKRRASK